MNFPITRKKSHTHIVKHINNMTSEKLMEALGMNYNKK